MSKISIAKIAATLAVQAVASKLAARALIQTTSLEDGDIIVTVAAGTAGWYAGNQLKPQTDYLVDMAAVKIAEFQASRTATA